MRVAVQARTYGEGVRDVDTIDQELRLIAALRATSDGEPPSITVADHLLDERLLLMRTAAGPTITVQ